MKKVVVMLITVLMMLSLVACGKKSEEEPVVADDGNETVETGYKLVSDGVLTVSLRNMLVLMLSWLSLLPTILVLSC